jgi:hypothetical protein
MKDKENTMKFIKELKRKTRIFITKAEIIIIMKNE